MSLSHRRASYYVSIIEIIRRGLWLYSFPGLGNQQPPILLSSYNPVEISHPHFDGDQGRTVCLDFIFHLRASLSISSGVRDSDVTTRGRNLFSSKHSNQGEQIWSHETHETRLAVCYELSNYSGLTRLAAYTVARSERRRKTNGRSVSQP